MPLGITRMLVAVLLALLLAGSAAAGKRVALVIGNSTYAHAPLLPNPKNDATDMAATLERLNFDVTLLIDQGYQGMRVALGDFSDKASDADIAVVFYAGHGIEVDKENFLIPVDARLGTERRVRFEAIPLDDVLLAAESAAGLQLVMLDACRDNPFAATLRRAGATRSIGRGLARIEPVGSSVIVAYAAREGQIAADGDGRNSPFTRALLRTLPMPGLEIGVLFRQVTAAVLADTGRSQQPFVYQSLGPEPIFLVPSGQPASPAPENIEPPEASLGDDNAATAWATLSDTRSAAVLETFIAKFPESIYAEFAIARLRELEEQARVGGPDLSDRGRPITLEEWEAAVMASPEAPTTEKTTRQRAIYYHQGGPGEVGRAHEGVATWSVITREGKPAIRATLYIPNRSADVTVNISRNYDTALPASYLVEIEFGGTLHGSPIQRVPALVLKQTEQARGQRLAGAAVRVTDKLFWIALSDEPEQVASNVQLLREGSWFDLPILYNDETRALLTFEKGTSGNGVFETVMASWAN